MAEIKQPTLEIQQALDDILTREPSIVKVNGKKRRIHWLHNGTVRKFSHIMVSKKDQDNEWKRNVKLCSCILLNKKNGLLTWFLLKCWFGVLWRWLYYVKDIDQVEILGVLDASKKKIQSEPLALATILSTEMMDTMMMMAQHEVGRAVQGSEQPTL